MNEIPDLPICDTCGQAFGGSHYHCSCASTEVTGMYGHWSRFCKKRGKFVAKHHHCGGATGCDLDRA